jgi:purine/pyrimidine-nucleoside phosphorylase
MKETSTTALPLSYVFLEEVNMDEFENVTVIKKANIYFNGNVTSRTILFADGSKKTLGIILPGQYEFGTEDREHMEVLAGKLSALLPGNKEWKTFEAGQVFDVPPNSKFKVSATTVSDYCCSYLKE